MNAAKIFHDMAMELSIEAKAALAKGDQERHDSCLKKAYAFDKEAALKMYADSNDSYWRYVLTRSAAWLALNVGHYEEAWHLSKLGLSGNPPEREKIQLKEILDTSATHLNNFPRKEIGEIQYFSGTLASADVDEGSVKIRENGKKKYQILKVSKEQIQAIVRFYLGEVVEIQASKNEKGDNVLKSIRHAA